MAEVLASRRGFLSGMMSLIAAPAIVDFSSLMPVRGVIVPASGANSLLLFDEIVREAIRLFCSSNAFLHEIDTRYAERRSLADTKRLGSPLRIRLPDDYLVRPH